MDLVAQLPEELRVAALTHPAFARSRAASYERLELLGDSVLDLVITEELYARHPDLDEGELSKLRAATVSRESCADVARSLGLGDAMVRVAARRGRAHEMTARRLAEQRNALAALTESVIGACFLARGYDETAPLVLAAFGGRIDHALKHRVDAKSELQELASRMRAGLAYEQIEVDGPPHDRRFTMAAVMRAEGSAGANGAPLQARGSGRSKQEAQQAAAAALLDQLEQERK